MGPTSILTLYPLKTKAVDFAAPTMLHCQLGQRGHNPNLTFFSQRPRTQKFSNLENSPILNDAVFWGKRGKPAALEKLITKLSSYLHFLPGCQWNHFCYFWLSFFRILYGCFNFWSWYLIMYNCSLFVSIPFFLLDTWVFFLLVIKLINFTKLFKRSLVNI